MSEQPLWFLGNRNPSITQTILNDDGTVHDLTGQTVAFQMRAVGSSALIVNSAATIVNPPGVDGKVRYDWSAADITAITTDVGTLPGKQYLVWWPVTTSVGGKTQDVAEALIEWRAHSNANLYVELEQVKSTLELTGQQYADQDLKTAISSASRAVDDMCDRRFYLDADATQVRYYTATSFDYLAVDDLVQLTTLQADLDGDGVFEQTWTLNTDFVLAPLNASAWSRPYTTIRWHPAGRYIFVPIFPRSVKVTGQFGWPSVPAPIQDATILLVNRLAKRKREAPFGVAGIGLDNVAVRIARTDPDVQALVQPYVRGGGLLV